MFDTIKRWIRYIKDYERISYDYSCVLDHATCNRMSKTNYYLNDIYAVINEEQMRSIGGIIASDIMDIVNDSSDNQETIDEIKEYLNDINNKL